MNLKIAIAQLYTSNVSYGKYTEEINKKYLFVVLYFDK